MPAPRLFAFVLALVLTGCAGSSSQMRLRRVVLYQNGVGYFERSGRVEGGEIALRLASHEVDDVLTTLTVVDESGAGSAASPSAVVPSPSEGEADDAARTLTLSLNDPRPRDMRVAYAAPTPVWRTTYRVVLDSVDADEALLQAWAVVYNASPEDWDDVELALATSAPFSFRVDLRDPRFADRPDANGRFTQRSGVRGPVSSTTTRGAAVDQDHDGILDVDDQCPEDAEAYNGIEDEDGCPDRGQVVITDSHLTILDKIYFAEGSSSIQASSRPIVEAIAATLTGNPQIQHVQIHGHAATGEAHAWAIAAERAAAVRSALVDLGVDSERLTVSAFGDTQPIQPGNSAEANERNRRVEFDLDDSRNEERERAGGVTSGGVAAAGSSAAQASIDPSGATRYGLARHVSIPAGSSSMVTVLNERLAGARVLLFRPDRAVDGSALHPMRAIRFENGAIDLVPGPVAIFAEGELLGQGLLDELPAERTAFIPYGLDGSTEVRSGYEEREVPTRVLRLSRGVLEVVHTRTRTTTVQVQAGARIPSRIFLTHTRRAGSELGELPPGAEVLPDVALLPLPLRAGEESTLRVEESWEVRRTVRLLDDLEPRLERYLAGSSLDAAVEAQLRAVIDNRERARAQTVSEARLRRSLADAASRNVEVRASLAALADATRTEASRRLRRELTQRLDAGVARVEALAQEIADARAERAQATDELRAAIRALRIEPPSEE